MSKSQLKTLASMMSSIRSRECNETKNYVFAQLCIEGEYVWLRGLVDHSRIIANKDILRRVESELDICPSLEVNE